MTNPRSDSSAAKEVTWLQWLQTNKLAEIFVSGDGTSEPYARLAWNPGEPDRLAAWQLYTELRTRVATQPLAYRSGDEVSALDSIYSLFEASRSIIKQHKDCKHFASLTVRVLNTRIRPFTAKWHRAKQDGRLSSTDVRFSFRRELSALQHTLCQFAKLLALLADDETLTEDVLGSPGVSASVPAALWDPIPFGIVAGNIKSGDADKLNQVEKTEILKRRANYSLHNSDEPTNAVGLAISGGGIRSATFALGVVQHLARKGMLQQVDLLSTVSGGGYLGAFMTSFLNDGADKVDLKPALGSLPFGAEGERESQGVRHLRNHSKYLSEGGFKTIAKIIALVAYGILVSLMLASPWLLVAVYIAERFWAQNFTSDLSKGYPSAFAFLTLVVLMITVALLPLAQRFGRRLRSLWERASVGLFVVCAVLLASEAIPWLFGVLGRSGRGWTLALAAVSPIVLGALGLWLGPKTMLGHWPSECSA